MPLIPANSADACVANRFVLVAEAQGRIPGAIEVCSLDHTSLFFVDSRSQRKGKATNHPILIDLHRESARSPWIS